MKIQAAEEKKRRCQSGRAILVSVCIGKKYFFGLSNAVDVLDIDR
jgi:hypothetical protein